LSKFKINDTVKIVEHTSPKYEGKSGIISEVHADTPAPRSRAIPQSGGPLPGLGTRTTCDVKIDSPPWILSRVSEEQLESQG